MITSVLIGYFLHQVTLPTYREKVQPTFTEFVSEQGTGTLVVTVQNTEGGTVAPGSQRVEMLRLTLAASCEADVRVESMTIQRRGLGSREDIQAVYAMSGKRRMSDARVFASGKEDLTLRFNDVTISACDGMDISLLADFAASASPAGEHRLEIRGADALHTNAKIVRLEQGTKPVLRRTVGTTVGHITFESLPLLQSVRYGKNRVVARFRMTASSGDDHSVSAVTLTNQGTAKNVDLQNFFIQGGKAKLSTVTKAMQGDRVRLVFSPPLLLEKNKTRLLELHADILVGRSRTIRFTLEETGDIEATPVRGRRR